jgi:hypothetical protein
MRNRERSTHGVGARFERVFLCGGIVVVAVQAAACSKSETNAQQADSRSGCVRLDGRPAESTTPLTEVLCTEDDKELAKRIAGWTQSSEADKKQTLELAARGADALALDPTMPLGIAASARGGGGNNAGKESWVGPITDDARTKLGPMMAAALGLDRMKHASRELRVRLFELSAQEPKLAAERAKLAERLATMVRQRVDQVTVGFLGIFVLTGNEIVAADPETQTLVVRYDEPKTAESVATSARRAIEANGLGAWRRVEIRVNGNAPRVVELPVSKKVVVPGFRSLLDDLESFGKDLHGSLEADLASATGSAGVVPAGLRGTFTADPTARRCGKGAKLAFTGRHLELSGCKQKEADGLFTVTKVETDGPVLTFALEGTPPLVVKRGGEGKLTFAAAKGWAGSFQGSWVR